MGTPNHLRPDGRVTPEGLPRCRYVVSGDRCRLPIRHGGPHDMLSDEYDRDVIEVPRCNFERRGFRCALADGHDDMHDMARDDGTTTVSDGLATTPIVERPPWMMRDEKAPPIIDDITDMPEDRMSAAPGTTVALLRNANGSLTPVDRMGSPILFFTCKCGGGGCDLCGYTGKLRTRYMRQTMMDTLTGKARWNLVATCRRCGEPNRRMCKPGSVVEIPLCGECFRAVMGVYFRAGRDIEAARRECEPLPPKQHCPDCTDGHADRSAEGLPANSLCPTCGGQPNDYRPPRDAVTV